MHHWASTSILKPLSYTCGHCGNPLSSNVGFSKGVHLDGSGLSVEQVYICHHCEKPTYTGVGIQIPGPRPGEDVSGIEDSGVNTLYKEARDAYSQNAFTATILCCRKLLMHIAVSKGADAGKQFIEYVEFLSSENYIPRDAKGWVDQIRKRGNEANHEIAIGTKEQANDLMSFLTMLLKLVYEFPSKVPKPPALGTA